MKFLIGRRCADDVSWWMIFEHLLNFGYYFWREKVRINLSTTFFPFSKLKKSYDNWVNLFFDVISSNIFLIQKYPKLIILRKF